MRRYPGIVIRGGASGRRASIAGRRLDVWQIIETLRQPEDSVEDAADYLGLRQDQVRAAIAYAADYRDEIEARIHANAELAERAMGASSRQRAVLGR